MMMNDCFQLAALEKRIADLEKNMGKDLKLLVSLGYYDGN